jgi:hypothetical protein
MNAHENSTVPNAIKIYQSAHDCRDVSTALAQFTHDAEVIDDGKKYKGIKEVETFLRKAGAEYTYTRTLVSADEVSSECWRITNHLEGDFPGGHVDLSYEFRLESGLISTLTIAP